MKTQILGSLWRGLLLFPIMLGMQFVALGLKTLAAQSRPSSRDGHTITLTPSTPSDERSGTIVAPGNGKANWKVFYIDTTAFVTGGVLYVDIQVSPNSRTDASFILLPGDAPIPTDGLNRDALVKSYNVRRGTSTRLEYHFPAGQVFAVAADGNWFSPAGAMGFVKLRAFVEDLLTQTPSNGGGRSLRLTPQTPYGRGTAVITAPGNGNANWKVFYIDATAFVEGGVIDIDVSVAPNSRTDASFILLPGNVPIPIDGVNRDALVKGYDVRRGTSARLQYRFRSGQVFAFAADGNWFSPAGATGTISFGASIHP